jgi:hypothetical protein
MTTEPETRLHYEQHGIRVHDKDWGTHHSTGMSFDGFDGITYFTRDNRNFASAYWHDIAKVAIEPTSTAVGTQLTFTKENGVSFSVVLFGLTLETMQAAMLTAFGNMQQKAEMIEAEMIDESCH